MYDDLARTQKASSLEWLTWNMVIPSVVLTLLSHFSAGPREFLPRAHGDVTSVLLDVIDSPEDGHLNPDVPPRLHSMPQPQYPEVLLRTGTEGHVVVRALVDAHGRIKPSSIVVLQAAHPEFADPVRRALQAAVFRPAWFAGTRIAGWVTVSVYFDIYWETVCALRAR